MKLPTREDEARMKKAVIDHFVSSYSRLLKDAGLKGSQLHKDEPPPIDTVSLTEAPDLEDAFNFNADFKVKNYRITFLGTINTKQVISNEVMWGKRSIR